MVLSPARRHALTDWARRTGGYVIEDGYDSEFRYDKEPVGALQELAPGCTASAPTAAILTSRRRRSGGMDGSANVRSVHRGQ